MLGSRTQELLGKKQPMGAQRSQWLEEAFLWPSATSGMTDFLVPKRQADAASGKFLGLLRSSKTQRAAKQPVLGESQPSVSTLSLIPISHLPSL